MAEHSAYGKLCKKKAPSAGKRAWEFVGICLPPEDYCCSFLTPLSSLAQFACGSLQVPH